MGIEAKAIDFNGTIDVAQSMIVKSDIVVGVVYRYLDGRSESMSFDKIKALGQTKAAQKN